MLKIHTVDIAAKEWFDKINGNSYFAAQIIINYQLENETYTYLPFQYGYGGQYEQEAISTLKDLGYTTCKSFKELREAGAIIRSNKTDKCLLREVKTWGKQPSH